MPKVALLIPASPNARFYSQIAALNAAVKKLPWSKWEPAIHVTMGSRAQNTLPDDTFERWRPYLREVQFTYVSDVQFDLADNWAQVDTSLIVAPRDADAYVSFDADTFPVSGLEEMVSEVHANDSIAGVLAHFAPPVFAGESGWHELARRAGLKPLPLTSAYSLMPTDAPAEIRLSPIYFNGGVTFYSATSFAAFLKPYFDIRKKIASAVPLASDFSGQLATAFALEACGMPVLVLPMRYNYPNDDQAIATNPGELEQAIVFHYLREHDISRGRIFASPEGYREFVRQPLTGTNLAFRDAVARALGTEYPFPSPIMMMPVVEKAEGGLPPRQEVQS